MIIKSIWNASNINILSNARGINSKEAFPKYPNLLSLSIIYVQTIKKLRAITKWIVPKR